MAGNTRTRETRAQRVQRAAVQPGGLMWPEIRVGRDVALERETERNLDDFQNELGRMNRRIGMAYVPSVLACHYLTDTEMRGMIFEKYPDASTDLRKSKDVYRKIGKSINAYIREQARYSVEYYNQFVLGERFDGSRPGIGNLPTAEHWVDADAQLKQGVSGAIESFGNNKFAFDLSQNEFLQQERSEIVAFLRQDEKLATRRLAPSWQPHATIFETHVHLTHDDVIPRIPTDYIPQAIPLRAPSATGA